MGIRPNVYQQIGLDLDRRGFPLPSENAIRFLALPAGSSRNPFLKSERKLPTLPNSHQMPRKHNS